MKASLLTALPRDRRGPGSIGGCIAISALGLFFLANTAAAAPPTTKTAVDRDEARVDDSYWRDRERGWFWYDDPPPEPNEGPKPKPKAIPTNIAPTTPKKPGELVEFEASPATEPLYTINPFAEEGLAALFVTHPPVAERVRRLRALDPSWREKLRAA